MSLSFATTLSPLKSNLDDPSHYSLNTVTLSLKNYICDFIGNYHTLRNINRSFREICETHRYTYVFLEAWSPFENRIPLSFDPPLTSEIQDFSLSHRKKRKVESRITKKTSEQEDYHFRKMKLLKNHLLQAIRGLPSSLSEKYHKNPDFYNYVGWVHQVTQLLIDWNFLCFNNDLHTSIGKKEFCDRITSFSLREIQQQAELERQQLKKAGPDSFSSLTIRFKQDLSLLPPEIKYYSQLNSLNLSKHRLIVLGKEIEDMTHLTDLYLQDNHKLQKLPEEIGNLKQLTTLNICRTEIKTLPHQFSALINLKFLHIDSIFPLSDEDIHKILPNVSIIREE